MRIGYVLPLLIAGAIGLAVNIWAQDDPEAGVSIHKPVRLQNQTVPYEPELVIRTTVHDYAESRRKVKKREFETTGRYVTFGLPRKYLRGGFVFPDQDASRFYTETGWRKDRSVTETPITNIHDADGLGFTDDPNLYGVNVVIQASKLVSLPRLTRRLLEAKESSAIFDGYKLRPPPGDTFWLKETYCGFEVFERDAPRLWQHEVTRIEGVKTPENIVPPFDHARVFGLPDGEGKYTLIVECEDQGKSAEGYCKTDLYFNEYINLRFDFGRSLLCQTEDVIDAHLELLRQSVVDEQTMKNEKWRDQ